MLVVLGGGGAVAHADAGTSNATDSGSHNSSSTADSSGGTSLRRSVTTVGDAQTRTEAREADDTDGSEQPRLTDDADETHSSAGDVSSASDSTADSSPLLEDDPSVEDNPTTDPSPPEQDNGPATQVDYSPDPPTTTWDPPTVPAGDNPTTDPNPPAQDTGSTTGPSSSVTEADSSSSGSLPSATASAETTTTDDSTEAATADPVSTVTPNDPAPAVDPTSVASGSSAVESVAATISPPALPAAEPSVVAPVTITTIPVAVPLASVTVAVAPPGILQWFVLLTWFQLQWLMQQQLSGPGGAPVLERFDGRDPRLMSNVFQNPSTTTFLATQLPWLSTTLGALQGMPLAALQGMQLDDLPINQDLLHKMSMTLAAESAALPAIAKALADQVHSHLGLPLDSPCVGTFIRSVSVWALFTAAALGLFGLTGLTGLGTMVGFRQAKAGYALHASGLARFTGPGPLGVVREAGFVRIGSRRSSAGPPPLRVIRTDLQDSA